MGFSHYIAIFIFNDIKHPVMSRIVNIIMHIDKLQSCNENQ